MVGITRKKIMSLAIIFVFFSIPARGEEPSIDQEVRERLIRVEVTLKEFKDSMEKRFEEMREDMNMRFEQVDKRFEQVDKRFEQVDKRFEQVDKRFEQVDRRFQDMISFMSIITGLFTAIMIANIGFAYWDRRTIIRKAKVESVEEIEKSGKLKDIIYALRELAKRNSEVAEILQKFHLL